MLIWTINNNGATEITRLQKNMVALEILAPSENLAPPLPQILKSNPQNHIFFSPLPTF